MKRLLTLLSIIMLVFAVAGCSTDKDETKDSSKEEKTTEKASELNDQVKGKVYNAVRIAELKVNDVFAKETGEDGETPVLTSFFTDEASVVEFLSDYYSEDISKEIYAHYVTNQKTAEGQTIVNAEPFFTSSIIETTKDDVKIEGDANKATVKTAENVTYTVELEDDHYVITGIE